jgi:hypothetical protein
MFKVLPHQQPFCVFVGFRKWSSKVMGVFSLDIRHVLLLGRGDRTTAHSFNVFFPVSSNYFVILILNFHSVENIWFF